MDTLLGRTHFGHVALTKTLDAANRKLEIDGIDVSIPVYKFSLDIHIILLQVQ
jgi:hypothetical protein